MFSFQLKKAALSPSGKPAKIFFLRIEYLKWNIRSPNKYNTTRQACKPEHHKAKVLPKCRNLYVCLYFFLHEDNAQHSHLYQYNR